jgi:ABC-2 type transport system permease protein
MFKEIFLFDLKRNFRKPQTYIFFGLYFGISLMIGLYMAGVFDAADVDSNYTANSALAVTSIINSFNNSFMGLINSIILVAVMATAIQKDYEFNTHPLYFTKPIQKSSYFWGRFLSGFTTALFVYAAQVIGYFIGCTFGIGHANMGPFSLINFIQPFLVITVPNVFLLGMIIMSITTFTRSTLSAYLFCVILLIVQVFMNSITTNIEFKNTAALLEPYGGMAVNYATEYWMPSQSNKALLPLDGIILYNRLLWLGIAILITVASYRLFSFSQFLQPFKWFKKSDDNKTPIVTKYEVHQELQLPTVNQSFDFKEKWSTLLYLAKFEFLKMAKSNFFIIILVLGMVTMFSTSQFFGSMYGSSTYPVTYQILQFSASFFQLFILILVVFFSGTIVWREKEQKVDELVGTTPVSNITLYFSKYLGLLYITLILIIATCITGMLIQAYNNFYDFNIPLYFKFILRSLVNYGIIIGICLAFQVFVPNKYIGFALSLIPLILGNVLFSYLEWNNQLYHFNSNGPGLPYSDMNGYGHTVTTWFLYKGYWLSIVLFVSLIAIMVYGRGKEKGFKARFKLSKFANTTRYISTTLVLLVCAIAIGAYIFYNTNVLHHDRTPKDIEEELVQFEKTYKPYERLLQPRIVSSDISVDLFPMQRSVQVKGFYYLKNKHTAAIDTLFLNYIGDEDGEYKTLHLQPDVAFTTIKDDVKFGVKLVRLQQALQPGDSIKLSFTLEYKPNGFKNSETNSSIVYNGTFFNNMVFPSIGYNPDNELSVDKARKKYGLPAKPRMAKIHDTSAYQNTYISNDADWITFETTVSTDEDQIAIAPGYLQKEWKSNGRRYFHYKMDSPILNFYSYLSARYQVKKETWNDINIEVYYQKGHEYNIDRMIKSIKQSLAYYTQNFGPYQHRQVRIIEFPLYASFAQAFPNTIPFSESIGFITKVDADDEKSIDVPFYITAHEVAHQWWAHQVIGANVQGSVLMSETMSQYSALMVMEKEYGKEAMKKFLNYEMDQYLIGRGAESKREVPLMLCENQGYIHYNKGSVVMYALRDYLGEAVLNSGIRNYLNQYKFQQPPYTTAIDFVNAIKAVTPDSLQYLITDMFETITVYDNYVKRLDYTKLNDGNYKVTLTVGATKTRNDSIGTPHPVVVNDYIDVGIMGEGLNSKGKKIEKTLLLQKVKMDKPEKTFEFIVKEKPISAGIDPMGMLIDINKVNNTWKFGSQPPAFKPSTYSGNSTGVSVKVETD